MSTETGYLIVHVLLSVTCGLSALGIISLKLRVDRLEKKD